MSIDIYKLTNETFHRLKFSFVIALEKRWQQIDY